MTPSPGALRGGAEQRHLRSLGIFANWRLQAYGYTLAVFYIAFFAYLYWLGVWLLNKSGMPVYHDFTNMFVAGLEALHGEATSAYDPVTHLKAQEALVGAGNSLFSNWPYPPTYFLILAPLAVLPYPAAFLTFEAATLLGCVLVVYQIVRRSPAIALVLASPFTAWNFLAGQSGFLTASLIGAALLFLERRPELAGIFIGCLSYKPQFGILFPVALIAGKQWRAFASAAATVAVLAGLSACLFGIDTWKSLPEELLAQVDVNLVVGPGHWASSREWGILQTVYGLIRRLDGGAALAWTAQGVISFGVAVAVWVVSRSATSHGLKSATLSAGALIATPYAMGYDLAAVAIPIAFLAGEQMRTGWLRGEQTILIAVFVASASIIVTSGHSPVGPLLMLTLFSLILRRILRYGEKRSRTMAVGPAFSPDLCGGSVHSAR
jgi:hypothetical protein